jgi:hypothetical protein
MTPPAWLTARNGDLRRAIDGRSLFVCFGQEPQYELVPLPVQGKHGCRIRQTINGKSVDCPAAYATADAALLAGLDMLRGQLGW